MTTKENIQQSILDFTSKSLFEAGINLFNTLGYNTSLQAPLEQKTYSKFQELYIENSQNKEFFNEEKAHTSEWKSIDILFQLTDDSFTNQQQLFDSTLNPNSMQSYLCFAVELTQAEYSKSTLAQITRQINKIFLMPIILIFRYGNAISLSVINRRLNKKDNSKDVLEKVTLIKDINILKPHRAHIEILFDMSFESLNTKTSITNFDTLHKAWTEVLDIELVTKKFFKQLFEWYEWVVNSENVHFPENATKNEKKDVAIIRLLTRLLFV